jgi:hypothetical protein
MDVGYRKFDFTSAPVDLVFGDKQQLVQLFICAFSMGIVFSSIVRWHATQGRVTIIFQSTF